MEKDSVLQKDFQVFFWHPALLEDAEEGAFGEFVMERDNGFKISLPEADMASLLPYHNKAGLR